MNEKVLISLIIFPLHVLIIVNANNKLITHTNKKFKTDLTHLVVHRNSGYVRNFSASDFNSVCDYYNRCTIILIILIQHGFYLIGKVFVGGHNSLYQLTEDLSSNFTYPSNCSADGNGDDDDKNMNINKVLLIDYENNRLIVCGTMKQACSTRDVANICNESKRKEFIVAETESNW